MILSRENGYDAELREILELAVENIQGKAKTDSQFYKLSGISFEREVCASLNTVSSGTNFHEKFEQASAHAFPDLFARIVENQWFGVEVKTSQKDWKCFGNSIFESTRVPNLDDRIYIFFGKFTNPLECRWGRYENCVDNINITHSPRYQIDMDIQRDPSLSVFSKMNTTYDAFHRSGVQERMEYVRKHKRKELGPEAALWWLPDTDDPDGENDNNLVIKHFSSLTTNKKREIIITAMVYFPEIFGNSNAKYSRLPTWLAGTYGVVTHSLRDSFSAGGKHQLMFEGQKYRIPKICKYLAEEVDALKQILFSMGLPEIQYFWKSAPTNYPSDNTSKLNYWIKVVSANLKDQTSEPVNFPYRQWLESLYED